MKDNLISALAELEEETVLHCVQEMFEQGVPALDIISALQVGMQIVGQRFEEKDYFLSELIMSAEIFTNATEILGDAFTEDNSNKLGTVLIGTVKDDIHDIGKNIVVTILKCNGFKVIDLGVDIPHEKFVEAIEIYKPEIVGMSCLLTTTFDSMKEAIETIKLAGLRSSCKIIIGGGPTNTDTCNYVNADFVCKDANEAVALCKNIMGVI